MKKTLLVSFIIVAAFMVSCTEECEPTTPACLERPPVNEPCDAYFERWFYNQQEDQCEQIGYSGCSQKGFATREECEECK